MKQKLFCDSRHWKRQKKRFFSHRSRSEAIRGRNVAVKKPLQTYRQGSHLIARFALSAAGNKQVSLRPTNVFFLKDWHFVWKPIATEEDSIVADSRQIPLVFKSRFCKKTGWRTEPKTIQLLIRSSSVVSTHASNEFPRKLVRHNNRELDNTSEVGERLH